MSKDPASRNAREFAQRAVLKRLAAGGGGRFVVRGGILMQSWVGEAARPTEDLDFAGTGRFDEKRVLEEIRKSLGEIDGKEVDKEVDIESQRHEVMFGETPFPGLRVTVDIRISPEGEILSQRIDFGFHDPMIPEPERIRLFLGEGPPIETWGVRRELGFAWKLHELLEARCWDFKHLYDLEAMIRCCTLDRDVLREAIRVAFKTHQTPWERVERLLTGDFGRSRARTRTWRQFRAKYPELLMPEDRFEVIGRVREFVSLIDLRRVDN